MGRGPTYIDPLRVGVPKMLWRGLRRRCPRCGGRAWFVRWFQRLPRCQTCGFRYAREVGFSLGAITINMLVTFGFLAVLFLVGFTVSYPDVAVVPMLVIGLLITIVVPTVGYPISYTLWTAVDIAIHPLDAADVAEADIALAVAETDA